VVFAILIQNSVISTLRRLHPKDSLFDEMLISYLKRGGFVYGGSAGAIIFGNTIKSAQYADDNSIGLEDLSGLDMAYGRDIFCHYSQKDNDFIANYENDLYILYEESGLFINNNEVQGIGKPFLTKATIG